MYKYQRFWDFLAKTYAKTPIKNQQAFNKMIENIRKHVNKTDNVFDFGCGTGTYSIAITGKVNTIHATDISKKMLSIACERASSRGIDNINFEHLEIFDKKLHSESYNVVLAFNILHLQPDLNKTLHRIYDLLAPGGLLISKTACVGESFSFAMHLMKPLSKLGLMPHVNVFTFDQLQTSISLSQLKILEADENMGDSMEYFVVAQKDPYPKI